MNVSFSAAPKRKPIVKMSLAGDVSVIESILKKKKLLEQGNPYHEQIRPLLLLPPGAMRGAIQAGVALGMEKAGVLSAFDTAIGVSAGAAVSYYTFAEQAAIGASVIYEDMVDMKFINFLRPRNIVNIDEFENVVRHQKPIDISSLRNARTKVVVGVTNYMTGEGTFLDIQKATDPLSCVLASMCIPIASGRTILVNGATYVDGSIANPLPLRYACETYQPTDILVVMNKSLHEDVPLSGLTGALVKRILSSTIPESLHKAIDASFQKEKDDFPYLTYNKRLPGGARLLVIYPHVSKIDFLTLNRMLLQDGILDACIFAQQLFAPVE